MSYRFIFDDDPWWKRLYARFRGWPVWHQLGYISDDDSDSVLNEGKT